MFSRSEGGQNSALSLPPRTRLARHLPPHLKSMALGENALAAIPERVKRSYIHKPVDIAASINSWINEKGVVDLEILSGVHETSY